MFNQFVKISFFKIFVFKTNIYRYRSTITSDLKLINLTYVSIIDNYYVK